MVAGSTNKDRAEEKHGGHEQESIGGEELHWNGTTNSGVEEAAERTMAMTMGNVAANTRPKALEDATTLSMVAVVVDRATANSADVAKSEEQATNDM